MLWTSAWVLFQLRESGRLARLLQHQRGEGWQAEEQLPDAEGPGGPNPVPDSQWPAQAVWCGGHRLQERAEGDQGRQGPTGSSSGQGELPRGPMDELVQKVSLWKPRMAFRACDPGC